MPPASMFLFLSMVLMAIGQVLVAPSGSPPAPENLQLVKLNKTTTLVWDYTNEDVVFKYKYSENGRKFSFEAAKIRLGPDGKRYAETRKAKGKISLQACTSYGPCSDWVSAEGPKEARTCYNLNKKDEIYLQDPTEKLPVAPSNVKFVEEQINWDYPENTDYVTFQTRTYNNPIKKLKLVKVGPRKSIKREIQETYLRACQDNNDIRCCSEFVFVQGSIPPEQRTSRGTGETVAGPSGSKSSIPSEQGPSGGTGEEGSSNSHESGGRSETTVAGPSVPRMPTVREGKRKMNEEPADSNNENSGIQDPKKRRPSSNNDGGGGGPETVMTNNPSNGGGLPLPPSRPNFWETVLSGDPGNTPNTPSNVQEGSGAPRQNPPNTPPSVQEGGVGERRDFWAVV